MKKKVRLLHVDPESIPTESILGAMSNKDKEGFTPFTNLESIEQYIKRTKLPMKEGKEEKTISYQEAIDKVMVRKEIKRRRLRLPKEYTLKHIPEFILRYNIDESKIKLFGQRVFEDNTMGFATTYFGHLNLLQFGGILDIKELLDCGFRFFHRRWQPETNSVKSYEYGRFYDFILVHLEHDIAVHGNRNYTFDYEYGASSKNRGKKTYTKTGYNCSFSYNTEEAHNFLTEEVLVKCKHMKSKTLPNTTGKASIFSQQGSNMQLIEKSLKADHKMDLSKYYNDDFLPVKDIIIEGLAEEDSKGIVLLHGLKGTGKTTFIKWLTTQTKKIDKNFIYMPSNLIHVLADPSFITFLIRYPNSIIIIEDGEKIIQKRTSGTNDAVSNILNFSDGIMSDMLNLQFIITFNTAITEIDEALLRKGRLIAEYEFKELAIDKCKDLVSDENKEKVKVPMALADVLFMDSNTGIRSKEVKKSVGFGK